MNRIRNALVLSLAAAGVGTGLLATAAPAAADGTITWAPANSVATGDQDNAAVAAVRTGYTAVVWEDDRDTTAPADNVHSDVFLRLYRNGTSLYETKLTTGGTGNWRHVQPDVALRENGTAIVVFATDGDGNGYYQIAVRQVSTSGTVTGSATANASATGQQIRPAVAVDPLGSRFAVAFEDDQDTTAPTVRMSGFASITAKSYEVQVHPTGGTHRRPDVAMGLAGNAIVAWDEDGDANATFNVARKVLTPTGGTAVAQAVANVNTGGQQRHPSVAANANGDFAVAWETDHTGTAQVAVRSFGATGVARSAVDTVLPGTDPQVGIDDQLSVAVAWTQTVTATDGVDVMVQGLNPDGSASGRQPRLRANTTVAGRQDEPALAVDPWGLITLAHTDDSDGNLFDQVYLGTGLTNSTW